MMKPAALRDATAANEQQKLDEKILMHQARRMSSLTSKRTKSRRNQEPGAAQQHRTADTLKEVAETQLVRSRQRKENLQNNRRMKT